METSDKITIGILGLCIVLVGGLFLGPPLLTAAGSFGSFLVKRWPLLALVAIVSGCTVVAIKGADSRKRAQSAHRRVMTHACCRCGMETHPLVKQVGGNDGRSAWFVLGLIGLLFFLIPGLICFAIGASLQAGERRKVCSQCHSEDLVPLNTPRANALVQAASSGGQLPNGTP